MAFLCGRIENMTVPERIFGNLKAGNEERNRNRKPYKEGRVAGVVAAVVILTTIIPTRDLYKTLACNLRRVPTSIVSSAGPLPECGRPVKRR
jgi:hypothetical protein